MKQKILDFIKVNKGALSLFMIVFLATFIMGALAALCGAESLTQVVLAACCGIIFTIGISILEKKFFDSLMPQIFRKIIILF